MSKKSTFSHYKLEKNSNSRRTFNIDKFAGVEYSRSQLEVQDYHATDIKNIIYRDGVNQKRSGYEQITSPLGTVNGIFHYVGQDKVKYLLLHIDNHLYKLENVSSGSNYENATYTKLVDNGLANHKSQAFESENRLYIIDGTKFRLFTINASHVASIENVEDSELTYIPTTTVGIPCYKSDYTTLASFEDPNIITKMRINTLISDSNTSNITDTIYYLDSKVDSEQWIKIRIIVDTLDNGQIQTETYRIGAYLDGETLVKKDILPENKVNSNGFYTGGVIENDRVGEIYYATTSPFNNSYLKFDADITTHVDFVRPSNEPNVKVIFPTLSNSTDKINKCTFGTVYNDRLFLSGNPDYPNFDFHSQSTVNYANDTSYGSFTYFSDLDYCSYGSSTTKVVGYDTFSDGELIVVKESARNEATLYRRKKEYIAATNYAGEVVRDTNNNGAVLYEEGFPSYDINNMGGEGGLNNRSIINFSGLTLILTKNGLKRLTNNNTMLNNYRILRDVSSHINLKIKDEDLENAFLFTFKEQLYLKTSGGVYVAYYDLKDDNYEFEWYYLDLTDLTNFFELDNELYFTKIDGSICRFNNEEYYYKDRDRIYTEEGSIYSSGTEDYVTISDTYLNLVYKGEKILIREVLEDNSERTMFALLNTASATNENPKKLKFSSDSNGEYIFYFGPTLNEDSIIDDPRIFDNRKVYVDANNDYYFIKMIENDYGLYYAFTLIDSDGNKIIPGASEISICFDTKDQVFIGDAVTGDPNSFYIVDTFDYNVDLININYQNVSTLYSYGIITDEKTVEAFYETKPYDLGSNVYEKTIWMYSILNDSNLRSFTNLGYLASRKQSTYAQLNGTNLARGTRNLDFSDFNFSTVSFLNDGLPHIYIKYKVIPYVSFIRWTFNNYSDTNMVISKMSLIYSISEANRRSK